MGFAKIRGKLTSRVGSTVTFGTPRDVGRSGGKPGRSRIIDEIWLTPEINQLPPRTPEHVNDWGDYSTCAQLIRWDDGTYNIRLAYYRRRCGEDWWEYASQTTVSGPPQEIKALCEKVLLKENWFRDNPGE